MTLRDYLHKNYITQKNFAEILEIAPAYLNSIVQGRLPAGKRLARDIESITMGEVTAEELRNPLAEKISA